MTKPPSVLAREAGTSTPARRPSRRRLSATHLLIALVVALAFVLNVLALQDRTATTTVAMADLPLSAGSPLAAEGLRMVPVAADFEGLSSLLLGSDVAKREGWILQRSIPQGGLIEMSDLVEPGAPSGLRSMSLPVGREHAAGGSVGMGDRIDVISVVDGVARFVATDLAVVGVSGDDRGGFGTIGGYHIVVAVTAGEALELAEALEVGTVEVIRSTGAPAVELGERADDS